MSNIKLKQTDDSGSVTLKAGSSGSNDVELTLPTAIGSNDQFLKLSGVSNQTGTLSFATPTDTTTPADNTVTAAKTDLSIVQGDVIYGSGTDSWARLAKGSAAQVLSMNSNATAPEWAAAGGGLFRELWYATNNTEVEVDESDGSTRVGTGNAFEISMTPNSATARLVIFSYLHMMMHEDAGQWGWGLKYTTDNWSSIAGDLPSMHPSAGNIRAENAGNERGQQSQMIVWTPGTTSAIKIGMFVQVWTNHTIHITANGGLNNSRIIVMELPDASLANGT